MLKVLVLEDQAAVREVIIEVAEELGVPMEVGQAGSLKEARQRLAEHEWDGLVTDLSLGDGQSLELIAELREQKNDIPVVLVSGFLSPGRTEQARQLGVAHILAKPFEPQALLNCLRETFLPGDKGIHQLPAGRSDVHKAKKLLPEIFEMDRHLGLLYRMFDEMPRHQDMPALCDSALRLAMEAIHAQRGYLALYNRQAERLVMVAQQGLAAGSFVALAPLGETPFSPLVRGDEGVIEALPGSAGDCWPGVAAEHYIAVPVAQQGAKIGVLCLMEWAGGAALKAEDRHMLGLLLKKLDTLLDNRATHAALATNMRDTLIALARSLEARDLYTRDHSARVSRLAVAIARQLGVDDETIEILRAGGLLHDIGKIGIPDAVLLKPGHYSDEEFEIMKGHPAIGDAILENMEMLVQERRVIRHHHERWDGRGYPDGLQGENIPLVARIACVADSIDAMTTHRVYRSARSIAYCIEQLEKGAGSQFDPRVVEAALAVIERGEVQTQGEAVGEAMVSPKGVISP